MSRRELWTTTQVAQFLGMNSAASARSRIQRWGLKPATTPDGAILVDAVTGERLYGAREVQAAKADPVRSPGRGTGPKPRKGTAQA